jgi:hypothetical protein
MGISALHRQHQSIRMTHNRFSRGKGEVPNG